MIWKETFASVGVILDDQSHCETMGFRVDEIVAHWHSKFPWNQPSRQEVTNALVDRLCSLVTEKGESLPGVEETMHFFVKENIPIAIASSSTVKIIEAVMKRLAIDKYLSTIVSAEHEEYGKPHPGVFITAAKKLSVSPRNCLTFEDSANGIIAAKAAKMQCVAVPSLEVRNDPRIAIADFVIDSLEDLH